MKRAAALLAALLAGCAPQNTTNNQAAEAPKGGPPPAVLPPFEKAQGADVTNDASRLAAGQNGERLFLRRCGVCHLDGGMGTLILARRLPPARAKLQDRTDLTPDFVIRVARNGQGGMPRITPVDATDAELQAIANYLSRRRP
jgi:mono/diheme cytochrome c family protein